MDQSDALAAQHTIHHTSTQDPMSTLKEALDRIREGFAAKAPESAKTIMSRATNDLRASGILDRIPKVGDMLTPFELLDTEGESVRSEDLLAKGPLVVTVYRGVW